MEGFESRMVALHGFRRSYHRPVHCRSGGQSVFLRVFFCVQPSAVGFKAL